MAKQNHQVKKKSKSAFNRPLSMLPQKALLFSTERVHPYKQILSRVENYNYDIAKHSLNNPASSGLPDQKQDSNSCNTLVQLSTYLSFYKSKFGTMRLIGIVRTIHTYSEIFLKCCSSVMFLLAIRLGCCCSSSQIHIIPFSRQVIF